MGERPDNRTLHEQIADALFALGTPVNAFETYESSRAHREEQAGVVLGVVRQAIRDLPVSFQTSAGFRLDPNQPAERIDHVERRVVLALFPEASTPPASQPVSGAAVGPATQTPKTAGTEERA